MTAAVASAALAQLNSAGTTNATTTSNNSTAASSAGGANRLAFNRLAHERKTVHVMNNKDISKRDRQLFAAAGMSSNLAATHNNYSAIASGINHNNLNGPSSTLDSHSSSGAGGGRNQTNNINNNSNTSGSFLQKLSSKFTRR